MNTARFCLAARLALAIAATLALGGCMVSYQADVRNESNRPIEAMIVHEGPVNDMAHRTKFIGPNDAAQVGPVKESSHRTIKLVVQDPGSPGTAKSINIRGGTTAITVQRMGEGGLVITETHRP